MKNHIVIRDLPKKYVMRKRSYINRSNTDNLYTGTQTRPRDKNNIGFKERTILKPINLTQADLVNPTISNGYLKKNIQRELSKENSNSANPKDVISHILRCKTHHSRPCCAHKHGCSKIKHPYLKKQHRKLNNQTTIEKPLKKVLNTTVEKTVDKLIKKEIVNPPNISEKKSLTEDERVKLWRKLSEKISDMYFF